METLTSKKNGRVQEEVYRKSTHTDKYLDFGSHHPTQHKQSVEGSIAFQRGPNSGDDHVDIPDFYTLPFVNLLFPRTHSIFV